MESKPPSNEPYDSSWDRGSRKLWDRKYAEWEEREWEAWLREHLSFPFEVERKEDEDDAYFTDVADRAPFRLGHVMKAIGLAAADGDQVIIKVREGSKIGYVPLYDVEVTSRKDPNFWPVREYVVWFANR